MKQPKPKTKKVNKEILLSWDDGSKEGDYGCKVYGYKNKSGKIFITKVEYIGKAIQPQPIKEESKPLIEKCPNCTEQDENIKLMPDGSCGVCGGKGYIEWKKVGKIISTPLPEEESKDIELPEFKIAGEYSMQEPPKLLIDWMKQVTDTLNSLTKRNIK